MDLADTSAWIVSRRSDPLRRDFDELVLDGELAICDQVTLELLCSARDAAEFRARRDQLAALPQVPIGPDEWARAIGVYEQLAGEGPLHHRQVKQPDLLIAAAAESAGITVLHYDQDYDVIAAVTGQPTRWITPRGSV